MMADKDVARAKEDDPDGAVCGFCGGPNDFADDIGWWYVVDVRKGEKRKPNGTLDNPLLPCCGKCFLAYHPIHQKYYGVGER